MAIVFETYITYGHKLTFHINMQDQFSSIALLVAQLHNRLVFFSFLQVLTLHEGVLAETGSGHILNLVSKDLQPLRETVPNLFGLVLVPLEILEVSVLLYWLVGWQALSGILYVIIILVYQLSLGQVIKNLRDKSNVATDARLRLVADVISGIRLIKSSTWENKIEESVGAVRRYGLVVK